MSIFGVADAVDHRIWQHRNLLAVAELVEYGVKRKLPPIAWRVPTIGTVTGTVETLGSLAEAHPPRQTFEAWFEALSKHPRVGPGQLGIRRDRGQRHEHTDPHGQTRMIAAFELALKARPMCSFCLLAEWCEEELDQDGRGSYAKE
ncbi:hypothetical protein BAY59_10660 [Prauserella coralliicola]|nr:hypothetical protein BAY59_10660 [Prauserella coralliicola]